MGKLEHFLDHFQDIIDNNVISEERAVELFSKVINSEIGKTTKIIITEYKDPNLQENIWELYDKEVPIHKAEEHADKIYQRQQAIFQYGEFMNAEIIVDKNLDIVGGKIIPFKKL